MDRLRRAYLLLALSKNQWVQSADAINGCTNEQFAVDIVVNLAVRYVTKVVTNFCVTS